VEAASSAAGSTTRRRFLRLAGGAAAVSLAGASQRAWGARGGSDVEIFLAGDVMTGRGIDQVLQHSVDPRLYEPWVDSAVTYVELAERASGDIPATVDEAYVWGDALPVLERRRPAARIINLETAVTDGGEPWPGKGIHYRMHPGNIGVLTAAGIDCCTLANNHVLDWGHRGLSDTLEALRGAGIAAPGAGPDLVHAAGPAVIPLTGGGRVLVFSLGHPSSGIPPAWAAGDERSGVWMEDLSDTTVARLAAAVAAVRAPADVVVASVHWGGNWGFEVPQEQKRFARRIITEAGVDLVHGHSSHHPKGIEVFEGRAVLYGCGDFVNDYEGIRGHESFRPGLRLMYLPRLRPADGRLVGLEMVPLRTERFRLRRTDEADTAWLAATMDRECRALGTRIERGADKTLVLRW
jgi:poly-gamma-glutamate synthesis protein (capsule biosynthesis protein)